jgi:four helix bundle protein
MSVWELSFKLLKVIYEITKRFPQDEKYGLISDMRRAANSISHNIAEGFGRYEKRDKTRFYKISRGSTYELISQTLVAMELKYIENNLLKDEIINQCKNIVSELDALILTLEKKA